MKLGKTKELIFRMKRSLKSYFGVWPSTEPKRAPKVSLPHSPK
jgi:hypothetical protein